jgi:hypothetical protein
MIQIPTPRYAAKKAAASDPSTAHPIGRHAISVDLGHGYVWLTGIYRLNATSNEP